MVVPGFSSIKSASYHTPTSEFAKDYYEELLADQTTVNKPVLITGGGSGSGKSSGLQLFSKEAVSLDEFVEINNTNLTSTSSAESMIQPALDSDRKVKLFGSKYLLIDRPVSFR